MSRIEPSELPHDALVEIAEFTTRGSESVPQRRPVLAQLKTGSEGIEGLGSLALIEQCEAEIEIDLGRTRIDFEGLEVGVNRGLAIPEQRQHVTEVARDGGIQRRERLGLPESLDRSR